MSALLYLIALTAVLGALFSVGAAAEHVLLRKRKRGATFRCRAWTETDYSAKRARALQQLGDAYLLARPINRRSL